MRFLDTNVFLRYFTRDNEQKAGESLRLLQRLEKNQEQAVTSPLVIFETIFTLESYYHIPRKQINNLLQTILNLRGLKLELSDIFEEALNLYTGKNISFADAFNICYMKSRGINEIYSYDEDFDKINGIKRFSP